MVLSTDEYNGTGISCKENIRKENFQMRLSLSFHNNKIVFKVQIFSPLQTYNIYKEVYEFTFMIMFYN